MIWKLHGTFSQLSIHTFQAANLFWNNSKVLLLWWNWLCDYHHFHWAKSLVVEINNILTFYVCVCMCKFEHSMRVRVYALWSDRIWSYVRALKKHFLAYTRQAVSEPDGSGLLRLICPLDNISLEQSSRNGMDSHMTKGAMTKCNCEALHQLDLKPQPA